jgi:hypothetical protein
MRTSNKNIWDLLDNQKVKEESLVDKLKRQIKESEDIRSFKLK